MQPRIRSAPPTVLIAAVLTACANAPEPISIGPDGIRPDGIGAARAGMTVAEIRDALEPDTRLGAVDDVFMVDLVALPVVREQDTLYYLVFPANERPEDAAVPMLVATDHPAVRTSDGVGPGTTLAEAAATYGGPRLSFSVHDEMREYATFPRYDHPTVRFRVAPGDTVFLAGHYETDAEFGETHEFDGTRPIMMVSVELRRP